MWIFIFLDKWRILWGRTNSECCAKKHKKDFFSYHMHGRCVLKSKYFHLKLMAQRVTAKLLIKGKQLTSQHMLDELLKIQVTPCEEINCCSSCIRICNMSVLEAKWRLFFISLSQNSSLSLQTDVPWNTQAWLYICRQVTFNFVRGEDCSRGVCCCRLRT